MIGVNATTRTLTIASYLTALSSQIPDVCPKRETVGTLMCQWLRVNEPEDHCEALTVVADVSQCQAVKVQCSDVSSSLTDTWSSVKCEST